MRVEAGHKEKLTITGVMIKRKIKRIRGAELGDGNIEGTRLDQFVFL